MRLLQKQLLTVIIVIASSTCLTLGSSVSLGFDMTYSGEAPQGASPWVLLEFADTAPQEVQLEITNNLEPDEFIDGLHLNLVDSIPLTQLVVTVSGQTGSFSVFNTSDR